ncbi:hypothetical protein IMZ48_37995 [Candidatus Bathyarchaeota archaeon]|nr:hypothetical protein [Candidatus Bathyarchaeota archaeon]
MRSALTKFPHSILERTYDLTVLHLSSGWPTGLSILLCAGAEGLLNETCHDKSFGNCTALDFAFNLGCEEAVALLFDAGCSWIRVPNFNHTAVASIACVQTAARKLAGRRQSLMCLAEETLTEPQLANIRPGTGVLDLNAAAVVQLLRNTGVDVPTYLAVPDSYATVYLSGHMDIAHIPIYWDEGFHDVNDAVGQWFAPIQVVRLDEQPFTDDSAVHEMLLGSDLLKWLEDHGFMELPPANVQYPEANSLATGWHILATRLPWMSLHGQRISDVIASRAVDGCRCACSSTGCIPLITALKVAWKSYRDFWCHGGELWEMVKVETAGELLRFLTFEALEMTHTCCSGNRDITAVGEAEFLGLFRGSVEETHDEEQELHRRLEELLSEFSTQWENSGDDLMNFVWGHWKERMAEECVPARDKYEGVGVQHGITWKDDCKSTYTRRTENKYSQGDS